MNELTGDIYVSEHGGQAIRKISTQGNLVENKNLFSSSYKGQVTTIAGSRNSGFADGQSQNAMFNHPYSICFSQFHDSLFVCDYSNHRIRIIELKTGIVHICLF